MELEVPNVRRLDGEFAEYMRASAVISSFSYVVQELVLNSIDANSSSIEIRINFQDWQIEVIDNGIGIGQVDLQHSICNWHITKSSNINKKTLSYGCHGECLAALNILAELQITSKHKNEKYSYHKDCAKMSFHRIQSHQPQGTSIKVNNLFFNLPVRRKSCRKSLELARIKEFIQYVAMLHHQIKFVLVDQYTKKLILTLLPDISVASRFMKIYGSEALNKMKVVEFTSDEYSIHGLLSPLDETCCHWNKECQYEYIGNRWMKSGDVVSAIVNRVYKKLLSNKNASRNGAKHFYHSNNINNINNNSSNNSNNVFPHFVLQLTCPPNSFDLVPDADNTLAVIHSDPVRVRKCVYEMMRILVLQQRPDLVPALLALTPDRLLPGKKNQASDRDMRRFVVPEGDRGRDSVEGLTPLDDGPMSNRNATFDVISANTDAGNGFAKTYGCIVNESPSKAFSAAFFPSPSPEPRSINHYAYREHPLLPLPAAPEVAVTVVRPKNLLEDLFDSQLGDTNAAYIDEEVEVNSVEQMMGVSEMNFQPYPTPLEECSERSKSVENDARPASPTSREQPARKTVTFEDFLFQDKSTLGCELGVERFVDASSANPHLDDQQAPVSPVTRRCGSSDRSRCSSRQLRKRKLYAVYDGELDSGGRVDGIMSVTAHDKNDAKQRLQFLDTKEEQPITYIVPRTTIMDTPFTPPTSDGSQANGEFLYYSQGGEGSSTQRTKQLDSVGNEFPYSQSNNEDSLRSDDDDFISNPSATPSPLPSQSQSMMTSEDRSRVGMDFMTAGLTPTSTNSILNKLNSVSLSKSMLENCLVLGQVNRSFIAFLTADGILVLADQHAADERIQLEYLQAEFIRRNQRNNELGLLQEGRSGRINHYHRKNGTHPVMNPKTSFGHDSLVTVMCHEESKLTEEEADVLQEHLSLFESHGFKYHISKPSRKRNKATDCSNGSLNKIILEESPDILGERLLIGDLIEFAHSVQNNLDIPNGLIRPPAIQRILNSKACRSAIRFGDRLNLIELSDVLRNLSQTKFPFQCAHGRPSLVPLIDVSELRRTKRNTGKIRTPDFRKLLSDE